MKKFFIVVMMLPMVLMALWGGVAKRATAQTLTDVWNGRAHFVPDNKYYGPSNMVFPTTWTEGNSTTVFYISPNDPAHADNRLAVGECLTSNGVNFTDLGTVIQVGPTAWDSNMASFPGVWKLGSKWAVVYEGAGKSPGDVGLATSYDGIHFDKQPAPILTHGNRQPGDPSYDLSWESRNIGTPSLWVENGLRFLFYHGFGKNPYGGPDVCQVGLATGTDLLSMHRLGAPVLGVGAPGSWDEGTIGRRSITKEADGFYYLTYEGSTRQPYGTARWSSGLARSTDLIHWQKYPGNPILPRTNSGFGYDGPQFLRTPDGHLYIYYRSPNGPTSRAALVWK